LHNCRMLGLCSKVKEERKEGRKEGLRLEIRLELI
jgi:hypothetical protein